jgi:hypothetical protein
MGSNRRGNKRDITGRERREEEEGNSSNKYTKNRLM